MHIDAAGVRLIAGFEGFSSTPYFDAYGRVWTRGFGETEEISGGSPAISRQAGETRLRWLVEARYEPSIRDIGVTLNQNQWNALCSFAWNLGAGIFAGDLAGKLRSGQYAAFADAMLQYDHAGGVVLEGLQRRRHMERALFLTADNPLGVLEPRERVAVGLFDALRRRWWLHPVAYSKVRGEIIQYRKTVWYAAVRGEHPGWGVRNRGARYRILKSRVSA